MTKLIKADFNGTEIQFNDAGFFNATVAADKFGKRAGDWVDLTSTQEYISEISCVTGCKPIRSTRGRNGGTMMHPMLAAEFFGWLGGASVKARISATVIDAKAIIDAMNDFEVPDDLPDLYIYAVRETETGRIKIGISRDPERRLRQLQTANSQELKLVAVRRAENRFNDERQLHDRNADAHIRGEWFNETARIDL